MTDTAGRTNPWAVALYSRALPSGDPTFVQVRFRADVLDRYRDREFEIKRTDTVGRLKKPGAWSLDFGIGKADETIHCSYGDLVRNLPEEERRHWAAYVAQDDLSESYCKMRLHPGSCIDDGDVRDW